MNENQRQAVRDNAKYLREVRPVDPEEIYEYVDGTPHPAAVRQVLREQAPSLGLVERDDGLFEPVEAEPVSVPFHGVDELPGELTRAVENRLVERFGPGWPDGDSGAILRSKIRDFKRRYLSGATVTYDEETALGYAIYHLPAYFAAVQYVLTDLAEDGLISKHLRVLDVGAGVGGPALGVDEFMPADSLVDYHAVEPSEAVTVLRDLLEATGDNFHPTVHETRIESFDPDGAFDLILFGNVLSELDEPAEVVQTAMEWLAPDGTAAMVAPADKNTAIQLRKTERQVERETDATIYAPTVRLWPDETPESESWSFRAHPEIAAPSFQRQLDEGERTPAEDESEQPPRTEEFVNADVQYAYSLLRQDGASAIDVRPDRSQVAKLKESERHVTDRIDCLVVKLSHDLAEGGHPLVLVADGSQKIDHFAVVTKETTLNADLQTAAYGEALFVENVLVLWNDDEQAYNLVVDEETIIDRIPA
ncbi:small ribosomal subunit Rsm22 family protein [Halovenus salina]|uniref:small ribosomal subunit Rsm22 family protein n=1 Tax=Halovenus salina TaxID=1510225 RepID=UPI002260C38A|nr:class I SAM-dependent methyltransferase [Halovenus salina]